MLASKIKVEVSVEDTYKGLKVKGLKTMALSFLKSMANTYF